MVGLGLVPHTGWAWLVRVRGTRGEATVELRTRVVACDVEDAELFHRVEEHTGDRERFLKDGRAAALRLAHAALAPYLDGGAAIVVGKVATLLPLEKILAAHPRMHGAEGELWRALFAEACAAAGASAARRTPEEVRTELQRRHSPAAIAAFLRRGRETAGAPWTREVQEAALAGWSALA